MLRRNIMMYCAILLMIIGCFCGEASDTSMRAQVMPSTNTMSYGTYDIQTSASIDASGAIGKITISKKDKVCLEENVFEEAGVEPYSGKLAVAQVTFNRLKTGRWGDSVCEVVHAPRQFSWTNKPHKHKARKGRLWVKSELAVDDFIGGARVKKVRHALYYHADYVTPDWANKKYQIARIGQHKFYSRVSLN